MAQGQIVRLTALAIATGTLVAAGVGPAAAATTSTDRVFDASGAASVLRIELNLPAAIPGLLPQHIVQDIVLTDGAARTGSSPAALGNAFIGRDGNVAILQDLLAGKAQTSLDKAADSYSLLSLPANPLGLTGGVLTAASKVGNPNADGVLSSSSTSVASLELKGAGVLGAVLAPVQAALAQALGATAATAAPQGGSPAAPVTATVTEVVNTALNALDGVTSDASAPVSDTVKAAVEQVTAELNTLLADLTSQVTSLSATDSLVDIGLVESSQSITRTGQTMTSAAANKLVGVDILGGLISVSGIESSAVASLGNGTTSADAKASLLKANVSDLLSVQLTDKLEAVLGGTVGAALPAPVLATVNGAVAQVVALLSSTLGLQVPNQARTNKSATADEATASVDAATLVLDPLRNPNAPLLRIGFVPAQAKVSARSIANTVITPTSSSTSLPRTGGSVPLALAGTVLVGIALAARRRRSTI